MKALLLCLLCAGRPIVALSSSASPSVKRVVFLPYGDSFRPTDRSLQADLAVVAADDAVLVQAAALAGAQGATVVSLEREGRSPSSLLLLRQPRNQEGLRQALLTMSPPPFQVLRLSAGPFATCTEAVHVLRRWKNDYYDCHRATSGDVEELERGGATGANSCFEFGGCHQRCWWRGGHATARVTRLHRAGRDQQGTAGEGEILSALNGQQGLPTATPRAASSILRRPAMPMAMPGAPAGDGGAEPAHLDLMATLVHAGDSLHYCGLYRVQQAIGC